VSRKTIILLALLGRFGLVYAQAEGVAVVLSSESGPYEEALAGFRESFLEPFTTFVLSKGNPDFPESTRLIVAIGGKAALHPYETRDVPLIYCVAPGVYVKPNQHPGRRIKVFATPQSRPLLEKLQELQPGLRRLGSFGIAETSFDYNAELGAEGRQMGVTLLSERLKSVDELPDRLRALKGHVDAIWIPPDPLLITPQSFSVMRQFALDNAIPLYVSIDGLAEKGASASVSVSYREMGRKAGVLAAQALSGSTEEPDVAYGDHVLVTINAGSVAQSGHSIPAEVLKKADRVIP
jgi:ABC-type uncharacterized transport system substrate-binding protein